MWLQSLNGTKPSFHGRLSQNAGFTELVKIVSFIIEHKASKLIDVQTEGFKLPMTFMSPT